MRYLLIMLTLLLSLGHVQDSLAQIYKHVDENGNVTFTDKPPEDATPVEVGRINSIPPPDMPQPAADQRNQATVEEIEAPENYSLNIISPMDDAVIPNGPGNFNVNLNIAPELHVRDSIQLFLDGDPVGEPQRGLSWGLSNVYRGTHSLEARVIDNRGQVKGRSPSVRVHVFRPIQGQNN